MLVFSQERQVIEREPQWRQVRRRRKEFEEILDDVLRRGEESGAMTFEDRGLTLLALLGMVNYTPQWLRPRGRLSPEEIADRYCDLILRAGGARARLPSDPDSGSNGNLNSRRARPRASASPGRR